MIKIFMTGLVFRVDYKWTDWVKDAIKWLGPGIDKSTLNHRKQNEQDTRKKAA